MNQQDLKIHELVRAEVKMCECEAEGGGLAPAIEIEVRQDTSYRVLNIATYTIAIEVERACIPEHGWLVEIEPQCVWGGLVLIGLEDKRPEEVGRALNVLRRVADRVTAVRSDTTTAVTDHT